MDNLHPIDSLCTLAHSGPKNLKERSIYRLSQNLQRLENSLFTKTLIGQVVIVGLAQKTFHW